MLFRQCFPTLQGSITITLVFCTADRALDPTMQMPWQGDQHEVITLLS